MPTSKVCSATILSVLLAIVLLAGCGPTTHPTDEQLLERFSQNEAGFEQLITMLREDSALRRVDDDWTDPEDPSTIGVTKERIDAYRELFKQLGIPRGFFAYHDPEAYEFIASAMGLGISGSGKGYAYLAAPPDLIVDNLDTYASPSADSFTAYRPIQGNWYLYLDNTR